MEAILQTLLGGFLALAGALVGPFLQRKHDRWLATRDDHRLLREKCQELFDELDRLAHGAAAACQSSIGRLQDESIAPIPMPDLGRIRAITALFFPSTLHLIDEFEANHKELNRRALQQITEALREGQKGLGLLKALPMLLSAQYQTLVIAFVTEIRKSAIPDVPKLTT